MNLFTLISSAGWGTYVTRWTLLLTLIFTVRSVRLAFTSSAGSSSLHLFYLLGHFFLHLKSPSQNRRRLAPACSGVASGPESRRSDGRGGSLPTSPVGRRLLGQRKPGAPRQVAPDSANAAQRDSSVCLFQSVSCPISSKVGRTSTNLGVFPLQPSALCIGRTRMTGVSLGTTQFAACDHKILLITAAE